MLGVCNFHAEAEILGERVRKTKMRRLEHLGVLVTATGADSLSSATLVGALLHVVDIIDIDQRETWAAAGAAFFQRPPHPARRTARRGRASADQDSRGSQTG